MAKSDPPKSSATPKNATPDNDGAASLNVADPAQVTAAAQEGLIALERMARAYADAASAGAGTIADPRATAPERAVELGDPDPFRVAADAVAVWSRIAADPARMMNEQIKLWNGFLDIWSTTARRAAGDDAADDAVTPAPGDKRWRDEEWSRSPVFDAMKQSYLLMSQWLVDMVANAEGVDPAAKRKVAFFTKQLSDAFAPTNFPMTNPAVLREAAATQGESVLRGLRNFARDLQRGHGRMAIRQTDLDRFVVGRDVAATPGTVVFENRLIQIIQYTPTTDKVFETPILIFPPWINKFYILDLRPDNSLVRWLLENGHQVFLASWVNPTPALADATFDDYLNDGIFAGLDAVREQSGQDSIHTVGYCIAGTLLAGALSLMGARQDARIKSATFFTAQTDFSEAGELLMFVNEEWLAEIERRMDANEGVLDGQTMADTFNMLRSNDLVWSFFVQNYLMGKDPKPFDLLFWNADATRVPKTLHLSYLRACYMRNALSQGEFVLDGQKISLNDITADCYVQAGQQDHIAPYRSVYKGARLFGSHVRFLLAGSGHIAGVVNPPAAQKYQYWTNDVSPLPDDVDDWVAGAADHPGSWWPDWHAWLEARSGSKVAPTPAEDSPLQPIEPAPGRYVTAP